MKPRKCEESYSAKLHIIFNICFSLNVKMKLFYKVFQHIFNLIASIIKKNRTFSLEDSIFVCSVLRLYFETVVMPLSILELKGSQFQHQSGYAIS